MVFVKRADILSAKCLLVTFRIVDFSMPTTRGLYTGTSFQRQVTPIGSYLAKKRPP